MPSGGKRKNQSNCHGGSRQGRWLGRRFEQRIEDNQCIWATGTLLKRQLYYNSGVRYISCSETLLSVCRERENHTVPPTFPTRQLRNAEGEGQRIWDYDQSCHCQCQSVSWVSDHEMTDQSRVALTAGVVDHRLDLGLGYGCRSGHGMSLDE